MLLFQVIPLIPSTHPSIHPSFCLPTQPSHQFSITYFHPPTHLSSLFIPYSPISPPIHLSTYPPIPYPPHSPSHHNSVIHPSSQLPITPFVSSIPPSICSTHPVTTHPSIHHICSSSTRAPIHPHIHSLIHSCTFPFIHSSIQFHLHPSPQALWKPGAQQKESEKYRHFPDRDLRYLQERQITKGPK